MNLLAVVLLLAGVVRHHAWELVGPAALVWNVCGAAVIALLILLLLKREPKQLPLDLVAVAGWFLYEEMLVAACSAWRIFDWWPVAAGEEQCSARIGIKLGSLSLVLIGLLIVMVARHERAPQR